MGKFNGQKKNSNRKVELTDQRTDKNTTRCSDCQKWDSNKGHSSKYHFNCPKNKDLRACKHCGQDPPGHSPDRCNKNPENKNGNHKDKNEKTKKDRDDDWDMDRFTDGRVPFATNNGKSEIKIPGGRVRGIIAKEVPTHFAVGLSKGGTSKIAEIPYCRYCNDTKHWTDSCAEVHNIARCNQSKFGCTSCHMRGHTADECNCPTAIPCSKCARKGHLSSECNNTKDLSVYDQYSNRLGWAKRDPHGRRFQWNIEGLVLTDAQRMRQQWLAEQQEMLVQGKVFSKEVKRQREQEIEDAERSCFKNSLEVVDSMDSISAPSYNGYDSCSRPAATNVKARINTNAFNSMSYATTIPRPTPTKLPTRFTNGSGRKSSSSAQFQNDLNVIRQMAACGASREFCREYEEALHTLRRKEISALELRVRAKCATSRQLCTLTAMNYIILRNEQTIMERNVLTRYKMNEVKAALYQGVQIYRDPKAMEALFARLVPRCHCCQTEGIFVDRHFSAIAPNTSTSELLQLEEISDWGVFVIFPCRGQCSKGGFSYERRYVSDEVGCWDEEDLEHKAWEIC